MGSKEPIIPEAIQHVQNGEAVVDRNLASSTKIMEDTLRLFPYDTQERQVKHVTDHVTSL